MVNTTLVAIYSPTLFVCYGSRIIVIHQLWNMATNVNITAKYTIAHKYGLPLLDNNNFTHWEHELSMWQLVTNLDKSKQAPVIYLSLSGRDDERRT